MDLGVLLCPAKALPITSIICPVLQGGCCGLFWLLQDLVSSIPNCHTHDFSGF